MAKRPGLNDDSFLGHLFAPKKNALPSGIRKRPITGTKGRVKGRVTSYNRMSPVSQEILRRSGLRDSYLKGETSLADARGALRDKAVSKSLVKPTKAQLAKSRQRIGTTALDTMITAHVIHEMRQAGYTIDGGAVASRVPYMPQKDKVQATKWKVGQIRAYAGDDDNVIIIDGEEFNPLWYHYN